MTRKSRFYLGVALLVGIMMIGIIVLFVPTVNQRAGVVYYLKQGTSRPTVISDLSQQRLIRAVPIFSVYALLTKGTPLKAGEYLFPYHATPFSIWRQLSHGTGLYYRHFTIVPGKTFQQVRQELLVAEGLQSHTTGWTDQAIMESLGNATLSPEGMFFPETYYYTRGDIDLVILKRAFDLMNNRLEAAWQSRAANLPYPDKYQALIAASLIEKEAYLDSERPIISGVIVNRLLANMLLQIDPTVIYGLGARYDGKIYKKDLLENTPYNTYVNKGLPPTPIGMPSMSSINAAMHPVTHHYLYFVAKGDGSHQFSESLSDHHVAVDAAAQVKTTKEKTP